MQPADYFGPIRQIWSIATCLGVSGRTTFHRFRCLHVQLKKAIDRGQDLGISGNPRSKQGFHSDSSCIKITWKSHRNKTNFLCVYTLQLNLFWDRIWIRLRIRGSLVKEFFIKSKTWRSYRGVKSSALWIVTTIYTQLFYNKQSSTYKGMTV
jgi:hypothetical protein